MSLLIRILSPILTPIIERVIERQLAGIKEWIYESTQKLESYKKHDQESQALIEEMANASTSEHKKAILRKLDASRATLK